VAHVAAEQMERARADSLAEMAAEAEHARRRLMLYRAKAYGPRPTSHERLRELERLADRAESRLNRVRADG
jgi:hypothetical protein